jgi:cytochrome b involved in lipid metabolism
MKKKHIVVAGIVVLSLAVLSFFVLGGDTEAPSEQAGTQQTNQAASESTNSTTTLTVTEVSKHSTGSDCWTIVDGKVYDITKYVPRHPGGDEILKACGKDGTDLFSGADSQGRAGGHSGNASSQLAQFELGELQKQ